jgi:hypothetical protein
VLLIETVGVCVCVCVCDSYDLLLCLRAPVIKRDSPNQSQHFKPVVLYHCSLGSETIFWKEELKFILNISSLKPEIKLNNI